MSPTTDSSWRKTVTFATLATVVVSVILFIIVVFTEIDIAFLINNSKELTSINLQSNHINTVSRHGADEASSKEARGIGNSGVLFKGDKIRTYTGQRFFTDYNSDLATHLLRSGHGALGTNASHCNRWSVVTTIFEPSDAVKQQAKLKDWCLLVVGDKKGPSSYPLDPPPATAANHSGVKPPVHVFLSADDQLAMEPHLPFAKLLPWNHFGRKNLGFLQAIRHGAKVIWDFDDDNQLIENEMKFAGLDDLLGQSVEYFSAIERREAAVKIPDTIFNVLEQEFWWPKSGTKKNSASEVTVTAQPSANTITAATTAGERSIDSLFMNPYPLMEVSVYPSPCWPRGFPIELIKKFSYADALPNLIPKTLTVADIGVVQSLANNDPDVDAIYRMTLKLPFGFSLGGKDSAAAPKKAPVIVPKGRYSPYNAQATLVTYPALWSLLLPCTIHGRVSDIWRSYFFQRLAADLVSGPRLVFSAPAVTQIRNAHNYLADFESEQPLYMRAGRLVQQLDHWQPSTTTLPGRMEELYIMLYEHGYLGLSDVNLMQAWIQALIDTKYVFPEVKIAPSNPPSPIIVPKTH